MTNIVVDDYANTCNCACMHKSTQTQWRRTTGAGRPSPNAIMKHLHTQEHNRLVSPWWLTEKATLLFISLRCFFPSKHPEQSAFASEPTPITIMRHICHINFVRREIYWFSKKSFFFYILFIVQDKFCSLDIWFGAEGICRKLKVQRSRFWVFPKHMAPSNHWSVI